jgi:uncharacterized membrane protein (DUF2068 family)
MSLNRSDFILRLIVIQKVVLSVLAMILSAGVLSLVNRDLEVLVLDLGRLLNLQADNQFLLLSMEYVTDTQSSTLIGVSAIGLGYAGLNFVEAYGLANRYRWAEYLTVIAMGLFIPYELFVLIEKPTLLRLSALVLNVLIVVFLARHKELFPRRIHFHRS